MAKYVVPMKTYAWTWVTVEADDPEEAADLADDTPSICAQCAGWGNTRNNTGIELGEWELGDIEDIFIKEEE